MHHVIIFMNPLLRNCFSWQRCRSGDTARWCTLHHERRNAAASSAVWQRSPHHLLCCEVSAWELDWPRKLPGTRAAAASSTWSHDSRRCWRLHHAQIWSSFVLSFGIWIISASAGGVWLGWWRDENGWPAVPVCFTLNCNLSGVCWSHFLQFSDATLVNCWHPKCGITVICILLVYLYKILRLLLQFWDPIKAYYVQYCNVLCNERRCDIYFFKILDQWNYVMVIL